MKDETRLVKIAYIWPRNCYIDIDMEISGNNVLTIIHISYKLITV